MLADAVETTRRSRLRLRWRFHPVRRPGTAYAHLRRHGARAEIGRPPDPCRATPQQLEYRTGGPSAVENLYSATAARGLRQARHRACAGIRGRAGGASRATRGVRPWSAWSRAVRLPLGRGADERRCAPSSPDTTAASAGVAEELLDRGIAVLALHTPRQSALATRHDERLHGSRSTISPTPRRSPPNRLGAYCRGLARRRRRTCC